MPYLTRLHREPSILIALAAFAAILWLIILPDLAFAQDDSPPPQRALALPADQAISALIGVGVMAAMYAINYAMPLYRSDKVKGALTLLVTAIAGGLYTALETGDLGFNQVTLQVVGAAVAAAFFAHVAVYKPTGIANTLGAGKNRQDDIVAAAP